MGGKLDMKSSPGAGTKIHISIPLRPARARVVRSSPRSGISLPASASHTSVNGGMRSDSQDSPDAARSRSVRRLDRATGTLWSSGVSWTLARSTRT